MFIQVIKAKVRDEQGIRASLDEWISAVKPGAEGYLGTTAGFLDDGKFVALARFDSREAAMRNSDRAEQGEWWARLSANFDGEADFIDADDVTLWMDGGSDDAGFVQVMVGHSPDVTKLRAESDQATERLREARPEIIGGTFGMFGDDGYVQTAYFRSEAEARDKEGTEPPDDVKAMIEERMRLLGDGVAYYDLHDPILVSR
ncbi:MAG TPA: hypothetical protein VGN35_09295 [Jatrophihabitantaceae bacterium]|jgi:hypothetical protein|nr:hypothetical protein [Jatrophihabitantaceae bacterium]